jgi:hypothetical protein
MEIPDAPMLCWIPPMTGASSLAESQFERRDGRTDVSQENGYTGIFFLERQKD